MVSDFVKLAIIRKREKKGDTAVIFLFKEDIQKFLEVAFFQNRKTPW